MFLINAHPKRGHLLEYGRLIERGVYKIITGKRGAFIGDGRLKEHGRLLEKIRYLSFINKIPQINIVTNSHSIFLFLNIICFAVIKMEFIKQRKKFFNTWYHMLILIIQSFNLYLKETFYKSDHGGPAPGMNYFNLFISQVTNYSL